MGGPSIERRSHPCPWRTLVASSSTRRRSRFGDEIERSLQRPERLERPHALESKNALGPRTFRGGPPTDPSDPFTRPTRCRHVFLLAGGALGGGGVDRSKGPGTAAYARSLEAKRRSSKKQDRPIPLHHISCVPAAAASSQGEQRSSRHGPPAVAGHRSTRVTASGLFDRPGSFSGTCLGSGPDLK